MNDQKQHWNSLHQQGDIDHYSNKPTSFALEVADIISPSSRILELGCGVGNDSIYFSNKGHKVLATDFSEVAIEKNKERSKGLEGLSFEVLDLNYPVNLSDSKFDVVYARLSLHYFNDEVTKRIFKDIHRVLKPDGFLCFLCKSIDDPLYGLGTELEKDFYEYKGHIRHFFSENYVRECLNGCFDVEKMESGKEKFYGNASAYVKVIARRREN